MTSVPIIFRQEAEADFEAIDALLTAAFGQPGEAKLVRQLRDTTAYVPALALVAEAEGNIIGHILFTRLLVGPAYHPVLALAPMAVAPAQQQEGVGSMLVMQGLQVASQHGFAAVVVLGHPNYYPRFGFEPASQYGITCPFPVPDEAFMAMPLNDHSMEGISGEVRYAPPFYEM